MISSPGCAGRSCIANAPGAARVEQRVVDAVAGQRRAALVGGLLVAHAHPHVGVDRVRARDRLARIGVQRQRAVAPRRQREIVLERVAGGRGDGDVDARRACRASPASARRCCRRRRRPARRPASDAVAPRAASAGRRAPGRGGGRRVSMLMTGIGLCSASSSSISCGPVRTPTAPTWRESTSAVSRSGSPRESCSSSARSTTAWPPSSCDADLEGHPRARRGLLEDQRDAAARQRARGQRRGLQLERAVEQRVAARRR